MSIGRRETGDECDLSSVDAIREYNDVIRAWRRWHDEASPQEVAQKSRGWAERIRQAGDRVSWSVGE